MELDYIIKYILCLYILFGSFIDIHLSVPPSVHKVVIFSFLITFFVFAYYDFVTSVLVGICAIVYVGKLMHRKPKASYPKTTGNVTENAKSPPMEPSLNPMKTPMTPPMKTPMTTPPSIPPSLVSPDISNPSNAMDTTLGSIEHFKKLHSKDIEDITAEPDIAGNIDHSPVKASDGDDIELDWNKVCAIDLHNIQQNDAFNNVNVPSKQLDKIQTNIFDKLNYRLYYNDLGDQYNIQGMDETTNSVSGYDATIY
jgi:hypothetical protein